MSGDNVAKRLAHDAANRLNEIRTDERNRAGGLTTDAGRTAHVRRADAVRAVALAGRVVDDRPVNAESHQLIARCYLELVLELSRHIDARMSAEADLAAADDAAVAAGMSPPPRFERKP